VTRVLCCAVTPWPGTVRSLREHAPGHELVLVGAADWRGYGREVLARWGQDDLLVVEQDNVIHAGVLPQLEACPEPWCVFPYRHPSSGDGFADRCLGCTRFRLEFQQKVTAEEIASEGGNCNRCHGQPDKHLCWLHVEGRVSDAAARFGFTRHIHWPSAGHRDVPPGEFPEEIRQEVLACER